MPQHHMVIPHYMGRSREVDVENTNAEVNAKHLIREESDSFSSESPPEDVPLLLPPEASDMEASDIDNRLNGLSQIHGSFDQPTVAGQWSVLSFSIY